MNRNRERLVVNALAKGLFYGVALLALILVTLVVNVGALLLVHSTVERSGR